MRRQVEELQLEINKKERELEEERKRSSEVLAFEIARVKREEEENRRREI